MKIADSSHVQFEVLDTGDKSCMDNRMCEGDFTALRSSSYYFFCHQTKKLEHGT